VRRYDNLTAIDPYNVNRVLRSEREPPHRCETWTGAAASYASQLPDCDHQQAEYEENRQSLAYEISFSDIHVVTIPP